MSEWVLLGSVAAALYVLECCVWLNRNAWCCFQIPVKGAWTAASAASLPGTDGLGAALSDPFRLSGAIVECDPWPFAISPDGLTSEVIFPPGHNARYSEYIPFEQIDLIEVQFGDVRINGKTFLQLGSSLMAENASRLIQGVHALPLQERSAAIAAEVSRSFDLSAIKRRWSAFRRDTRVLKWCSIAGFAYTFVVVPTCLFWWGPLQSWLWLAVGLFGLSTTIAILFFRVHARLYPTLPYDRWVQSVSMVLFPIASIRSVDRLSRELLRWNNPMAVVPVMCSPEDSLAVLRRLWFDLSGTAKEEIASQPSSPIAKCSEWFRQTIEGEAEATLGRLGADIFRSPSQDDPSMTSYCPRCQVQYRDLTPKCADCPSIDLVRFEDLDRREGGAASTLTVSHDG